MFLITNRNNPARNDRFEYYLFENCKNVHVKIAVAFFTDYKVIEKMLEQGCSVDLIVRLNDGTSPDALRRIYTKQRVRVRYFTSAHFHPKLYLIPHTTAFIGSSNLTKCALNTNNEVNIQIDFEQDSEIFDELDNLFMEYWTEAIPLDNDTLSKFEACMKGRGVGYGDFSSVLGDVAFSNVQSGNTRDKKSLFIDDFKRSYLEFVKAFSQLKEYYSETQERRWHDIPLRIELDRFLWWLGETQYKKDEWNINETYSPEKIKETVKVLKPDFIISDMKWLFKATENYKLLTTGFESKEKIDTLSEDTMFEILENIYSFHDSSQYHKGGIQTLKDDFFDKNKLTDVQRTIKYLLFGTNNYIERIFDCIYGDYKLTHFGESSVKELFGYVNKNELPIFNGRIRKSMAWLGFGNF